MSEYAKTGLNKVRRVPQRAAYDRETVHAIVDAAPICHVGLIDHGRAVVIPTIHARSGDELLIHGSTKSRLMTYLAAGGEVCITVTMLDGLVLARSVFHHSMNYRSAVLYGRGQLVDSPAEKMAALECFTNKLVPGRWEDARQPTAIELKATHVVAVPIDWASAKVRTGAPVDDAEDYELDVWAGIVPVEMIYGAPQADERLRPEIDVPPYLAAFVD